MGLTFNANKAPFNLERADINRYPGSLLHSLIETTSADGQATVDLDSLPNSPFCSWPPAAGIMVAMYRLEHIPVNILGPLMHTHTPSQLFTCISSLLDYLQLPGPISKWMPRHENIPIRYLGVLNMCYYAAAVDAVGVMLDCDSSQYSHRAAAYLVTDVTRCDSSSGKVELAVHQVFAEEEYEGSHLGLSKDLEPVSSYVHGRCSELNLLRGAKGSRLPTQRPVAPASAGREHSCVPLDEVEGTVVDEKHMVYPILLSVLEDALIKLRVGGHFEVVKGKCIQVEVDPEEDLFRYPSGFAYPTSLWVLYW